MTPHRANLEQTKCFIINIAAIVGMRCTEDNFRFNVLTFITCMMLLSFKCLGAYSIIIHKDDTFRMLETLCGYGFTVPSAFKLVGALQRSAQLRSVWKFGAHVYESNDTPERSKILYKSSQLTKLIVRVAAVIFLFEFAIFAAYPTYNFIWHGKLTLFISLYIPYVDSESVFGFSMHMLMQFVMSIYAAAGNMCYDLFMALVICIYRDLVTVLEFQMKQLSVLYAQKKTPKMLKYRKAFMRNLLLQFTDTQEYVKTLNDIYALTIFVQIASSSVAITVSLFSIVANDWVSGYGFVLFALTQIQIFCLFGTIISTQNARVCDMIYATPWYLYDPIDKKLLLGLLQMCQNTCTLWIGPLAPLNVETGTDIVRNIFRYYTMIVSFLE